MAKKAKGQRYTPPKPKLTPAVLRAVLADLEKADEEYERSRRQ